LRPSFATLIDTAPTARFTNTARGLMPLAPANLGGAKQPNRDFIPQWQRRARLAGG
jgi:hypothetical protein